MVDWSVDRLVGRSVGWSVRLVGWSIGRSVGWLVGRAKVHEGVSSPVFCVPAWSNMREGDREKDKRKGTVFVFYFVLFCFVFCVLLPPLSCPRDRERGRDRATERSNSTSTYSVWLVFFLSCWNGGRTRVRCMRAYCMIAGCFGPPRDMLPSIFPSLPFRNRSYDANGASIPPKPSLLRRLP